MRVLLVTHYYSEHRGGIEIVASELARRLVRRGPHGTARGEPIDVAWVASAEGRTRERRHRPDEPAGLHRFPTTAWNFTERRLGFPYPLWAPQDFLALGQHVRACDVVHLHDSLYLGNVAASLWARRYRKPVVVTQHIGLVPYNSRLLRFLLRVANQTLARLVLGGADQVLFISPRVQEYFSGMVRFKRPPLYLPNGVDTDLFCPVSEAARQELRARLGWPADRKVRLFVGRFVEKKGLPMLRRLAAGRPRDLWVFVGWGPVQPAEWGLSNVIAAGGLPQKAIVDYYHAADLLVLPSVGEGFPLVVQEAMACGLPALISPETLEGCPDASAVIASADLTDAAWNATLDRLDQLDPVQQRQRVADFAQRWNWDRVADEYIRLYETLLRR